MEVSHRALWLLPAAAVAVVLVFVIGLSLGWGDAGEASAPARPFAAATALSARTIGFGDPLTARLDLVVDPVRVDAAAIEVRPRFGAYRITGTRVTRTHGVGELISYRYALECLQPACVAESSPVQRRFPPVTVSYRTEAGQITQQVAWPSYQLSSRVTAADRRRPVASMRYDASLPEPSYRIAPGTLRALLAAAAALLVLGGAVLAWLVLRPRPVPGEDGTSTSRLEQALRAVRASSTNGRPAERRKALGWLGRELRALRRPGEADEARRLAWSADAPTSGSAAEFATRVEGEDGAE